MDDRRPELERRALSRLFLRMVPLLKCCLNLQISKDGSRRVSTQLVERALLRRWFGFESQPTHFYPRLGFTCCEDVGRHYFAAVIVWMSASAAIGAELSHDASMGLG